MSIADLKLALADVPGIEKLTMSSFIGRQIFGIDGLVVGVDAGAAQDEIERAIREAIATKRPRLVTDQTIIPPAPAIQVVPAASQAVSRLNVTGASFVGQSFRDKMQALRDELNALPGDLDTALTRVRDAAKLGRAIVTSVHKEADDLMATFGQFTNESGDQQ